MKQLQKQIYIFLMAVLAGIAIGIGGCVFLSLTNKIVGAFMFSVGLYIICTHELGLYTGKVGYAAGKPPSYWLELLVTWAGNLSGTYLAAAAVRNTRMAHLSGEAANMCSNKLNDDYLSLFLLGIFCGFLMYAAVEGYKTVKNPLILFAGVAAFILCGFEHCIADMFYFSIAGMWSARAFLCIFFITLGNSVGGMLIPLGKKVRRVCESKS